jgi:uncharacterized protein YdaU (DUF1376 family)
MSFAFLPLYTGDYLRDTRHLTPQKHGVYLLLLMHCWDQKGPLPLDEQECAGIANCRSADEIESLRYVLDRYFVRMEDGYYQGRMQREVERAGNISKVRSEAGHKGFEARAKHLLSKSRARVSTPTPTTTTTLTPTTNPSEPPVVCIPLNDGSEYKVFNGLLVELERLYPGLDPVGTLKQVEGWSRGNPTRRKTRTGILRHIHAWFSKEQNRV